MSPTQTRSHALSYLKGYLRAYALLNTFVNDFKTYTIDILPKTGDVQSVLRDFYQVKNWVVTMIDLGTTGLSPCQSTICFLYLQNRTGS